MISEALPSPFNRSPSWVDLRDSVTVSAGPGQNGRSPDPDSTTDLNRVRQVSRMTPASATFILISSALGNGILTLPYALTQAGLIWGLTTYLLVFSLNALTNLYLCRATVELNDDIQKSEAENAPI